MFSHLSESLDGLVTIRAFKKRSDFIKTNYKNIDRNTAALSAFNASARWLGIRLDAMSTAFMIAVTFGAVAAKKYGAPISPAILGVGILYVLQLTGLFQWAVRQSAEVENLMISVERIISYAQYVYCLLT